MKAIQQVGRLVLWKFTCWAVRFTTLTTFKIPSTYTETLNSFLFLISKTLLKACFCNLEQHCSGAPVLASEVNRTRVLVSEPAVHQSEAFLACYYYDCSQFLYVEGHSMWGPCTFVGCPFLKQPKDSRIESFLMDHDNIRYWLLVETMKHFLRA